MSVKRALVCAPRMPEFDRESGSRRTFHLIEFLQEAGWAVCFVANEQQDGERYARLLQQRGIETFAGFNAQTEQLIAASSFDLAIFAFWHLAEKHIPTVRWLSPRTRVIVDMIDLHFLRDARRILCPPADRCGGELLDLKYAADMIGEVNVYAMADAVMAVSQKEADLVNDLTGDVTLASTVPDHEDLPASGIPFDKRNGILFVGNFWHQPNVSAAEYLCRDVLPRLDPALIVEHPVYIVGNALDDRVRSYGHKLTNVRMVGWVPSVLPYLNQARISVIPLLHGAGTKRKLLQALMVATPTVSTSVGTEGINLTDGEHVLVANDPDTFANSIARLLKDEKLWNHLSQEGRKHIQESHGRENARALLMKFISSVVGKEPKPLIVARAETQPEQEASRDRYHQSVQRMREIVRSMLPEAATVVVVSKGDDDLLQLDSRKGWHFPQGDDGLYAGHYPSDSTEAITQLEKLRNKGADYLIFPSTAFWWLEHYAQFRRHLEGHYREILREEETCVIFALRQSDAESSEPHQDIETVNGKALTATGILKSNGQCFIDPQVIAKLRPIVPQIFTQTKTNGRARATRVLVVGIYLANNPNNIDDIVATISNTHKCKVTQRWVALGGGPPTKRVADVTTRIVLENKPKFEILNELLAKENLARYDYALLVDDDIVLPDLFLDKFIPLQQRLDFSIAQPARTSNSYIDHPIVEQQRGVLARQTLFVEIGPVVSFHKSAYELVFPFDLTSSMGWGYENVWAHRVAERQMKMGIIDAVSVDHSLRPPVTHYSWDEADRQRKTFLQKHEHLPLEQCFRVVEVVGLRRANNGNADAGD